MPHRLTLRAMSAGLRSKKISSVELVRAHLDQIERVNPAINAFVTIRAEEALRAARQCDATDRGGPLHGIPITVKDSFNVEGLPTRAGSRLIPDTPVESDSAVVASLRRAGAIILGKTNTPEFLSSYDTDNHLTGRTNNPWDPDRTPGGSSGGEAAAISACCSAGGVGSDGGGSIRIPAHFCGIAGLKPTPGRISLVGHTPPGERPPGLLSVAGPMARTAADLEVLFHVLSPPVDPQLKAIRIGLLPQFYSVPVHPSIADAADRAARALESLGYPVEPFAFPSLERAPNLWNLFFGVLPARENKDRIAGREHETHWTSTENLDRYLDLPPPTEEDVRAALAEREAMRSRLIERMQEIPVLLMPAASIPAFRHRERRFDVGGKQIGLFQAMMLATTFNVLALPALVLPFGQTPEGLPVAVQLVGRPFEEEVLLDLAIKMEEARGPFPAPLLTADQPA